MRTFVIGDIHGAYKALGQCLRRANFDYFKDHLIALGDVCDGWPQVKECVDELLKIKKLDYIIGNHDLWALKWAEDGIKEDIWVNQGGKNTLLSYANKGMPKIHIEFLKNAHWYFEYNNKLFVHAGFDPFIPMSDQNRETLVWDRELIFSASDKGSQNILTKVGRYEEIFLGHTTTQLFNSTEPVQFGNIWALDTGAGWSGKLTIMNVDTKQYWQSDLTPTLYPNVRGR